MEAVLSLGVRRLGKILGDGREGAPGHRLPRLVAMRLTDLGRGRVETPPTQNGQIHQIVRKGREQLVAVGRKPVAQHPAGTVHVVSRPRIAHRGPHRPGPRREPASRDGHPRGAGRDVLNVVGLVEHDHVVGREDLGVGEHVQAVEVGVHDQHIHVGRRVPGPLREALRPRGAVLCPRALPPGDAHRLPGPGGRLEVESGPVPVRGLVGPSGQPFDFFADSTSLRSRAGRDQLALLTGRGPSQIGQLLEAEIVRPSLEHRELQRLAQCSGELGQVLLHKLILESLGGGGHDRLLAAHRQRRKVGHRLAGAGAGRHHQMPVLVEGYSHGLAHLPLTGTPLPAVRHGRDDRVERLAGRFYDAHGPRR